MKKFILVILILSSSVYSQKISEDKVDDFTKEKITRTDWEKISSSSSLYLNVRINKINDKYFLELKFFPKGVSSIDTNDDMSFMLKNNEIINLKSVKYEIANYGDGSIGLAGSKALGFDIHCELSDDDIQKFKSNLVTKIRLNKSEGYAEDDIKEKNALKLKEMFSLIHNYNANN